MGTTAAARLHDWCKPCLHSALEAGAEARPFACRCTRPRAQPRHCCSRPHPHRQRALTGGLLCEGCSQQHGHEATHLHAHDEFAQQAHTRSSEAQQHRKAGGGRWCRANINMDQMPAASANRGLLKCHCGPITLKRNMHLNNRWRNAWNGPKTRSTPSIGPVDTPLWGASHGLWSRPHAVKLIMLALRRVLCVTTSQPQRTSLGAILTCLPVLAGASKGMLRRSGGVYQSNVIRTVASEAATD